MKTTTLMLYKALNDNAAEWRDVPFSRDAWDAESLGSIETPLGVVTLEPEAVKSYSSGRLQMLGALRPCLEAPSFVTIGEGAEFYRAFKGASGLIGGYVRASVRDGAVSLELTDVPASIDSLIAGAESWVLDVAQGEEGAAVFKSLFTRGLLVTDFELALAVIGEPLLRKAEGAIPAGARWITVHPNGDGTKGVPVLVQEEKHGSGVFRVIGGAGGKLNYMKIRGVKSEGEYKQDAAEKAKAKKDARKAQVERDKAAGTHEAKQEARKAINDQRKQAERDFIRTVADAMGWDVDAHVNSGVDNVDAALTGAAQKRIHGELLQKAKQAVKLQREKLATDADARAAAGLGEVPLDAKPDQLSVDDLKPTGATEKVVSHDFKQRAEKNGLTAEKLAEVNHSVDVAELGATAAQVKAAAAVERGEAAKALKESLDSIELPDLKPKVVEAKKAVALIKADKQLKAMVKAAREANKAVDNSHAEPKAYVLAVSAPTVEDVAKEVEDSVRTVTASALLSEVRDAGGEEALSSHVFTGAHNAINAVTQAVAGASLIDRSAVDVLGVAGVAQVLARRLHGALDAGRVGEVKDALDKLHAETQAGRVSEALAQAKELQDAAAEIELGEAAGADDLSAAVELSRQRKQHLADARKVIGQALGEGEAYASLIHALGEKPRDEVQLSLGQTSVDSAVRQLYALGLGADDFALGRTAGNVFVTVKASGMDKLAAAPDAESVERVARNLAIQRGDYDEDNWLPQGFANRPDLALDVKAGVADRLSEAYDFGTNDHEQALRDYIGARFADGDAPADILADIQSANFFNKIDDKDGYRAALDAVAPLTGKDGKAARIESLAPVLDQYADDFVASRWGGARTTLNRQTFSADDKAQDALHRALADEPAGKAAYKPIGELTSEDTRTLRDFFAKSFARGGETNAQGKTPQQVVEELAASEPDRFLPDTTPEWKEWHKRMADVSARYEAAPENQREELSKERAKVASEDPAGIFSAEGISPEWESWSAQMQKARDDAKNSRGLNWEGYCTLMGGRQKAYEALQDCIRSKVSEGFAHHYNKLNPGKLLKVGKTIIRGNLQHAEAVDPKAAAVALAKMKDIQLRDSLRERNNGRYASGSTSHKMEAAREQREAFEQAQMVFFAAEELPPTASAVGVGERYTIGHAAEQKINAMMGVVGSNFESGKPVKLFQPTMSGGDGYKRQRAIKLIDANKRVILGAGVGSGKTAMGLGAFAHLHSQGKVKKGLFVVPSIVQGQFGAEALRFLKPGQFDWHCEPGGSYEDRLAAYKDPSKHFAVVTHQSFRDDILKMAGEAGHGTPDDVTAKLAGMSKQERADFTKGVLAHHGIAWDYVMADEAHGLLNRQGKENSGMSNAIEGVTDAAEYYVHASGDPVKNDACIHPETPIRDAISGVTKTVAEWKNDNEAPFVWALNVETGTPEIVRASVPFIKSKNRPMFRVSVDTGDSITVASDHRFLTPSGWKYLSDFVGGELVACAPHSWRKRLSCANQDSDCDIPASSENASQVVRQSLVCGVLPPPKVFSLFHQKASAQTVPAKLMRDARKILASASPCAHQKVSCAALHSLSSLNALCLCAFRCLKKAQGCQGDCLFCCRPYGEQPRTEGVASLVFPPLQAGALPSFREHLHGGAIQLWRECSRLIGVFLLSSYGAVRLYASLFSSHVSSCIQSLFGCSISERPPMLRPQFGRPCTEESSPQKPILRFGRDMESICSFKQSASENKCAEYRRVLSITQVESADIYDLEVPVFHNYLACGIWNHNTEAFSLLQKMDGARYSDQAAFMRRYGGDTQAAKEGLQRELARHLYAMQIKSGQSAARKVQTVKLGAEQQAALEAVDKYAAALRVAKMEGRQDIDAAKALAPGMFDGAEEADHSAIAGRVADTVGILKDAAIRRVINTHAKSAKLDALVEHANARKGKQGVVFARNLEAVESIRKRLEADGHRVVTLTGKDSSADKAEKIRAFNPDKGDAQADIIVCSDAGATGANLQSGRWLVQYDTPDTAMTHAQRQGRIDRVGQKGEVELTDLVADHESERRARSRLANKYGLRQLMTSPLESLDDSGLGAYLAQTGHGAPVQDSLF